MCLCVVVGPSSSQEIALCFYMRHNVIPHNLVAEVCTTYISASSTYLHNVSSMFEMRNLKIVFVSFRRSKSVAFSDQAASSACCQTSVASENVDLQDHD